MDISLLSPGAQLALERALRVSERIFWGQMARLSLDETHDRQQIWQLAELHFKVVESHFFITKMNIARNFIVRRQVHWFTVIEAQARQNVRRFFFYLEKTSARQGNPSNVSIANGRK